MQQKNIKNMHEHQKILSKIEKLVDQLPYQFVKIEIEMKEETLTLEKNRNRHIGFAAEE